MLHKGALLANSCRHLGNLDSVCVRSDVQCVVASFGGVLSRKPGRCLVGFSVFDHLNSRSHSHTLTLADLVWVTVAFDTVAASTLHGV